MYPKVVLYNGKIYTMDPYRPFAEAVAICGNRIAYVGSTLEVRKLATHDTLAIDLKGRAVLPGFTDAHIHLVSYALMAGEVDLNGTRSPEEAVERVRRKVVETQRGKWVLGRGWDRNLWSRNPRKEELDAVSSDNPVALHSKDGHSLWVNSLALMYAGITRGTVPPEGGIIERDKETGEPTGILREKAQLLIEKVIPEPSIGEVEAAVLKAIRELQSFGITAVTDFEGGFALKVLQSLQSKGLLGLRITLMLPVEDMDSLVKLGIRSGFGSEVLQIGGVKIVADGALGSGTAAMLEPYEDERWNSGFMRYSRDRLQSLIHKAASNGLNVAVHCIGDRANKVLLDIFEDLKKAINGGLRHRIEHAQHLTEVDVKRFGELGVVASVQPIHIALDMDTIRRRLGSRGRWAYPFRALLDGGAILAFGSDAPVERFNPFLGIYTAVTRRRGSNDPERWHPEQCITLEEAVRAYTVSGAYANSEDNRRGTISVGKFADLIVLSRDIFETPVEQICEIKVEMTFLDGEVVYKK